MKIDKKLILKSLFPALIGGILGYSYYYFIGCRTGACPITSNPWVSTMYGAVAGFVMFLPSRKKADDKPAN